MLGGQMSLRHMEFVQDGPRNLPLNQERNSLDITDIEFVWGVLAGVKSILFKTQIRLG